MKCLCCFYLTDSPSSGWLGVLNEFLVPRWSCPSLLKQKSCSPSGTTNLANQNRISRWLADKAGKAEVDFTWPLFFFSSFEKRSVSLCIPDRPGTHRPVCLCLPGAGIKMSTHAPDTSAFYKHSRAFSVGLHKPPLNEGTRRLTYQVLERKECYGRHPSQAKLTEVILNNSFLPWAL